ncbi:MAG TPA: LysR family transcriptional regulator [Sphingomonas sp.]|jgi:DNA-binding transcriptional LysR family regulator
MEMHQVRYFLAVARTLNFTRAAEESNVTQPSLTRAIQKLEEEFGGLLFRRERALTHLTDLGRLMLPHLERAYEAAQAAKTLAKGVGRASVAPLSLGIAAVLRGAHFHESISEVGASLPGFQLKLTTGDAEHLMQDLMRGDIDMLILAEPRNPHERLDVVELFRQVYAVVAPVGHPIAAMEGPALSDLADIAWIQGDLDIIAEFREHCSRVEVEPDFRHSASSGVEVARMVAAGLGCAILTRDEQLPEGLSFVEIANLEIARRVVLAAVAGRKRSTAGDALIRAVRARSWA